VGGFFGPRVFTPEWEKWKTPFIKKKKKPFLPFSAKADFFIVSNILPPFRFPTVSTVETAIGQVVLL